MTHRRRRMLFDSGLDPISATGGTAAAWFDVGQATNLGSGLAFTVPNRITANHATTSTDARKPTISTSANGLPILVCSASNLLVPMHDGINGATQWWISMHMRITTAAGNPVPFSIDSAGGSSASGRKLSCQRFVGDNLNVHDSVSPTTLARRFGPATLWPLNTWVHCIWELNLATGGAEATRGLVCSDGVPVVSTFADALGTPGDLAVAMIQPTGSMNLLCQATATGGNGWVGEIGPDIVIGSTAMTGVTTGCLTSEARAFLSAYRRPT